MTDQEEKTESKKKKLTLNRSGKLELKRTVSTGQVRQSFSHGRTKPVTVEVRRKRTYKPTNERAPVEVQGDGTAAEIPVVEGPEAKTEITRARILTEGERAARLRALEGARQTETEIAENRAEMEARERRRREEEEQKRQEEERRQREEEERQRQELLARRRVEEEERKRLAEEAAKLDPLPPSSSEAEKRKTKPTRGRTAEVPDAVEAGPEPDKRAPRGDPRKTAGRRGVSRRSGRKLTISQALDDEERMRSLASVRRQRERERRSVSKSRETVKVFREVTVPETITVQELANRMTERAGEVIKVLMNSGIMATITQTIDADTAELIVRDFGHTPKRVSEADVEIGLMGEEDHDDTLLPRPPIVTVMGHVDHGKTTLLDALRETDVAAGETGGITQHIGAYQVRLANNDRLTFIDTPGHEAFTAMRSRGANVTDIVILVVAADDGVMPQTVEAIDHAKAAKAPIIVAINKIDRPDADPSRVRNELLAHDLVVESLGGDIQDIEVSATQKTNLDQLVEAVLLQAEILELRANPDRSAEGVVIEAKLETGRGPVATVLVQRGTLSVGDIAVVGTEWGRARALVDASGERIPGAGPSTPVELLGLNGAPNAGDEFAVVENEARAREISEFRQRREREIKIRSGTRGTIDEIFSRIQSGEVKEIPVVVKGDVQGSVEAISQSAQKLGNEEVSVRVLHTGVGAVNESDVTLANASEAMLIGFNVRANAQARNQAREHGVDIRYYSIIYDLTEDLKQMLSGMLAPQRRETFLGNAGIKEVFNISKVGRVAGCEISEGLVRRGASVRLLRDNVVIHEGKLATLKRFKNEVREVTTGFECGMAFENYQDLRPGDVIECFEVEEITRTL